MPAKQRIRGGSRAREQLNNVGLKATPQRLMVLHVLHSHERQHLTAADVYQRIVAENGRVGMATVYRVLGQLTHVGIVSRHIFNADSAKAVYEVQHDRHHNHLICYQCGRVEEFVDDAIAERSRGVAESKGYWLTQHHLALHGYCAECAAASKEARS